MVSHMSLRTGIKQEITMSNPNPQNQWKPGKSANPGGRPKRSWTWSGLLEQVANEIEGTSGKPFKELVTKRLFVAAVNGDVHAMKEIFNRMEGLPRQGIDLDVTSSLEEEAENELEKYRT